MEWMWNPIGAVLMFESEGLFLYCLGRAVFHRYTNGKAAVAAHETCIFNMSFKNLHVRMFTGINVCPCVESKRQSPLIF